MKECYRILRERKVNYDDVAGIFQGNHNTVPIEKDGFSR